MNLDKLFPFLGIHGKLLVAFAGFGICPLGILGVFTVYSMTQELVANHAHHLRMQLETSVGHIEGYLALVEANSVAIGRHLAGLKGLGEPGEISSDTKEKVEEFFLLIARMRPDYGQLRLISPHGRELARVNRFEGRLERVAQSDLQDKSGRYYFKEAVAATDGTYVSPIDLNIEQGEIELPHSLVFRVGRSLDCGVGKPSSLFMINVFAHHILDVLKPLRWQGEVLLIDSKGRFMRELSNVGKIRYEVGDIREHLADFAPIHLKSLVNGSSATMVLGETRLMSYSSIRLAGDGSESGWRLAILHPKDRVLAPIFRMRRWYYYFAASVAIVAFLLSALATRALANPIRRILDYVSCIAAGDFRCSFQVETRDEIEQLATGVQEMAHSLQRSQERLLSFNEELQAEVGRQVAQVEALLEKNQQVERQLRHADRLASLGLLSASLAHEIGNPLASMKTAVQVNLQSGEISDPSRSVLEAILKEIDRLGGVLRRMTGFVRPAPSRRTTVTLGEIYRRILPLLERDARDCGITFRIEGDASEMPVALDDQKLEQVLFNLMANALQAIHGGGAISIAASILESKFTIVVIDTGPGIPMDLRPQVFEPFVTTKESGTGLGLPIVRRLVTEMDGHVSLEFPALGGTLVRIVLQLEVPDSRSPMKDTT